MKPSHRTAIDGGPLLLAIAFAPEPALDGTGGRRTLEELGSLGIPLERLEAVPGTFPALAERFGLPAECVWYVTAHEADALGARAAGLQAILVDPAGAPSTGPDERGLYVAAAVEGVLEIVRVPYTRSALNMRYIMRTVLAWDI
jgi:hypothetical protein